MTTPAQKLSERQTVDTLLAALGISADCVQGETPDFVMSDSGKAIGVEITMFRTPAATGERFTPRAVESAWEELQDVARKASMGRSDLARLNVGLMFKSHVPPQNEHRAFIEEVANFASRNESKLVGPDVGFCERDFTSPLMRHYLRTLYLGMKDYATWYSNKSAGWVGRPDRVLADIVIEKSNRKFRPTDELWLAIQCSHRISETVLPIEGIADFAEVPELNSALRESRFSKVFILAFNGIFAWDRMTGWSQVSGDATRSQGPSFHELKAALNDPEWLVDPNGKARRVAEECVRDLRSKRAKF